MKKVGLSMSGGGVKGVIYLGIIKLLEERNIPIDVIGGLSAGALISGLYSSGKSIEEIIDIVDHLSIRSLIDINPFDGIEILDQAKVLVLLKKLVNNMRIEDCNKKLIIFATNLEDHKLEVITEGDLASAMLASACLPPLFHPIRRDGKLLSEGGFTVRFGAKYFRNAGAEYVIGADVNGFSTISLQGLISDFYNSISSALSIIKDYETAYDPVDITIESFNDTTGMLDFQQFNSKLVDVGYKSALDYIDLIEKSVKKDSNLLSKILNIKIFE